VIGAVAQVLLVVAPLLGLAAGCGRDAPQPQAEPMLAVDAPATTALGLELRELVTGGAAHDEELPMIVALHGYGDAPAAFASSFETYPGPCRFVFLRGPSDVPGGSAWFPFPLREAGAAAHRAPVLQLADRLARAVAAAASTRPTRGRPAITGFSQGALLSFVTAAHHPEVVAAAFPVAGSLPASLQPAHLATAPAVRIAALHGDADARVPLSSAEASITALADAGLDATLVTIPGADHRLTDRMRHALFDLLRGTCPHSAEEGVR
jgi:phospholipase/carboxylesterase